VTWKDIVWLRSCLPDPPVVRDSLDEELSPLYPEYWHRQIDPKSAQIREELVRRKTSVPPDTPARELVRFGPSPIPFPVTITEFL
jgi:hypothetical protein